MKNKDRNIQSASPAIANPTAKSTYIKAITVSGIVLSAKLL
jgi:hypothetical protein